MSVRRGERLGWLLGWLGSFLWVFILSAVLLVQGRTPQALIGLLIACVACGAIAWFSPWRHPETTYRLLMVPIYLLLLASLTWAIWSYGSAQAMGFNSWWSLLILLPIATPMWTVGSRRWVDGEAH